MPFDPVTITLEGPCYEVDGYIEFNASNPVQQDMCHENPGDNYDWMVDSITVPIGGYTCILPKNLFKIPEVDTSSDPEFAIATLQLDKDYYDNDMPSFLKPAIFAWFASGATATFEIMWGTGGVYNSGIQYVNPPSVSS